MEKKSFLKETKKRIKQESPEYFKRLRKIGLTVSGIAISILAAKSFISGFIMPPLLDGICSMIVVFGITTGLISTTAKKCKEE